MRPRPCGFLASGVLDVQRASARPSDSRAASRAADTGLERKNKHVHQPRPPHLCQPGLVAEPRRHPNRRLPPVRPASPLLVAAPGPALGPAPRRPDSNPKACRAARQCRGQTSAGQTSHLARRLAGLHRQDRARRLRLPPARRADSPIAPRPVHLIRIPPWPRAGQESFFS